MRVSLYIATVVTLLSAPTGLDAEGIETPAPELLHFIGTADQVYAFPLNDPLKPHRDDKHLRLLASKARRKLVSLLRGARNWFQGFDDSISIGPQSRNVGLLFRHGENELVLFLSAGGMVDARSNGQRQGTRWNLNDRPA
jgi:hypothetical protein